LYEQTLGDSGGLFTRALERGVVRAARCDRELVMSALGAALAPATVGREVGDGLAKVGPSSRISDCDRLSTLA